MANYSLLAVDGTLTYVPSDSVTPEILDAYQTTMTFAQAAARAAYFQKHPNDGAAKTTSDDYFNPLQEQLQEIGWNVTAAGEQTVTAGGEDSKPADIIIDVIGPYLDSTQQQNLRNLFNNLESTLDVGVHNFLDFWWHKAEPANATDTEMAIGPIIMDQNGLPTMTLVLYDYNWHATSWRALFVSSHQENLSVNSRHLKLELAMSAYEAVKDALKQKLGDKMKDHIDNTNLDL